MDWQADVPGTAGSRDYLLPRLDGVGPNGQIAERISTRIGTSPFIFL